VSTVDTPADHRSSPGLALVVVGLITAVAAVILLMQIFGTTNTRASVDGTTATSALPIDD
jgi:hypothetical protein